MTGIRLGKPWIDLNDAAIAALPGQLGVYEIADEKGRTLQLGFAGGRSRFGCAVSSPRRQPGTSVRRAFATR